MTEYRFVTLRQPLEALLPPAPGGVGVLTIDFDRSIPELADHMDGWEVVNFQTLTAGEEVFLVLLLRGEVRVE